jgi:hypothetical protein
MTKKKFNVPQKEHSVSLSPGNVATRRRLAKPDEMDRQDPVMQAQQGGPALVSPQPQARRVVVPPVLPASPKEAAVVPAPVPRRSPAAAPTRAPVTAKPQPRKAASPTPRSLGKVREASWAPEAPAPLPDPLSKTMPVGSSSRRRLFTLRSRNTQLRQQLELLESNNPTSSHVLGEFL